MSEPGSILRSLSGRTSARNFHSFVINEIGAGVVSGRFAVGSALPNDAEMMASFNVSRTVLREALKTLESKGLLEARPKVGTKVSPRGRWNLFDAQVLAWHFDAGPDKVFLDGLVEVRRALEPLAAENAARYRSNDHLRLMHYWLHQMEISAQSTQNFALADFELHRIISDASHNPFIRATSGVIELSHAFAYVGLMDEPSPPRLDRLVALHRKLVQTIEKSEPADARQAMLETISEDILLAMAAAANTGSAT